MSTKNSSVNSFGARDTLEVGDHSYEIYRLDAVPGTEKLPYSLKVLAENLLRTEDGARLPLTLAMLLFDSSGVNRDAARGEHSEALASVTAAAGEAEADRFDIACALDWLLYDWLMAHRVDADSAEIVIPKGREDDAAVVVAAVAASVAARATFDPALGGR